MSASPDIEPPDALETSGPVQARFGIQWLEANVREATTAMSMPAANMVNPFTGQPTLGPLAVLVDDACGMINFYRHAPNEWAVSSELTMEFSPDALSSILAHPDTPVLAKGRAIGSRGGSALATCTMTHGKTSIGLGTVRSFFIPFTSADRSPPIDAAARTSGTTLADLMAVRPIDADDHTLRQLPNPNVLNAVGTVHGGVASAALELVASAAVNSQRLEAPLLTGSVRVNFMRPFAAGTQARYVGSAIRVGRATAVGDATAIGDDGKACLVARITAYC